MDPVPEKVRDVPGGTEAAGGPDFRIPLVDAHAPHALGAAYASQQRATSGVVRPRAMAQAGTGPLMRAPATSRWTVSPATVLFLSFLWPGLGHAIAGRRRAAAGYATPYVAVGAAIILLLVLGVDRLAIELLTPGFALVAIVLTILAGAWRLIAMADGVAVAGRSHGDGRPIRLFLVLAAVTIVAHGVLAYYAWSFYDAGSRIFIGDLRQVEPGDSSSQLPSASLDPGAAPSGPQVAGPEVSGEVAQPAPTPTGNGRITILITGIDSGQGRNHALNDSLIVASIDPTLHLVSMISMPRDVAQFPLWDGRVFLGKINSLQSYAVAHPDQFPDGGAGTLVRELGFLIGIPINYYAAVNLDGFPMIVDALGGVDVVNDHNINDPVLHFQLTAGPHHLAGPAALLFVRSRSGPGDSDFTRALRQQQLLTTLAHMVASPAMLPMLPNLLQMAGQTVRTTFPASRIADMLALTRAIPQGSITRYVLGPPYSVNPPMSTTGGSWILRLDMAKVAALSVDLFGAASRYASK